MVARGSSLASRMFSESIIAICIVIGVLLMWIASLIGIFGEGTSAAKAMAVLKNTATALISTVLIGGGVANVKMERVVRVVAVIIGAIMLLVLVASVQVRGPWLF